MTTDVTAFVTLAWGSESMLELHFLIGRLCSPVRYFTTSERRVAGVSLKEGQKLFRQSFGLNAKRDDVCICEKTHKPLGTTSRTELNLKLLRRTVYMLLSVVSQAVFLRLQFELEA
jgi:hypothetical protein